MQKIKYPYNLLSNALFRILNFNKIALPIPLPKWQKLPDHRVKKSQLQLFHVESHSKNSAHRGFLRSKSPRNYLESN